MAASVAEILLRISPDVAEAKRELLAVAKQVQQFDSEDAEATVDVDSEPAERKLKDVFGDLAKLAREKVTARVDADTTDAVVGLDRVAVKADVLDAKSVDVEVGVDTERADRGLRGFISRLGGVLRGAGKVNNALGELSQAGFGAVTGASGQASGAMENFSGSVGTGGVAMRVAGVAAAALAAIVGPVMVAAVGSAVVAITALVASLTLAAGALGVLAVGFGSLLAPAVLFAMAAVERFKRTADIAGTAANALKATFQDFAAVFRKAFAPGIGNVFEGIAAAMRIVMPLAKELGPVFTRFGEQAGRVFVMLAREFVRPVWVEFFRRLVAASGQALPQLTRLFISLLRVVRNLVLVVLPFLPVLLNRAAGAMGRFAKGGAGVDRILGFFGDALPHLRAWLGLIGAIADIFLGFLGAAAPAGQELVEWLTQGAQAIGDWVRSADGQERIRQFFADTLPLVKQTVELFARLALLAVTAFQAIAPALQAVISQMNFWLGLIQKIVNAFNTLSPTLRGIIFPLNGLAAALGYLSTAAGTVVPAFKDMARGVANGAKAAAAAAARFMGGLVKGIASVAGEIRDTARSIVARVVEIVRGFTDNARAAGTAVFTAVRNGIASVAGAVRDAARSILQRVIEIVRSFIDNARAAGASVFGAVRNGIASVADNVREAARSIIGRVIEIIRSFVDNANAAGARLLISVNNGIVSVADTLRGNVRSIIDRCVQIVLGLAGSFFNAGKALVSALANGIAAGAGAAIGRLQDLAGKLRGLLPFSEPKDPSSPLRGLAKSGRAIVGEIAKGIAQAGPLALGQLSTQLAASVTLGAPSAVPAGGGLGDLSSAIRSLPTGSTVGPTVNVNVNSLVPADSASLATIADVVTDALSRQGYRGAKVQVVG